MLWSWVRHWHAERTLEEATHTLGFDRAGRPIAEPDASAEKQLEALLAIAKALDSKSSYTLGHSRRVERHARRVAEHLEMSPEEQDSVALAALLHDLGNVAVSDELLRKVGDLTNEERSVVEQHVLVGAAMAARAAPDEVVHAIRHHHERWEGGGYPNALSGAAIPLAARIIGIAEAYDAMTSTRPYRQGLGPSAAISTLRAEAGSQFDPELVEVFVSTLKVPSAVLAPLQGQVRELGLVLRRVGAVALSATASTIAIALILGSSVLSPGTFRRDPSTEVAQGRNSSQPDDQVLGTQVSTTDGDEASDATDDEVDSTDAAGLPGDAADPTTDAGDGELFIAEDGSVIGPSIDFQDDDAPSGGGTDPGGEPQPGPGGGGTDPEPQPEPEPPPPTPAPQPEPEPEPQPEPQPEPTEPPSNGNGNGNGNSGEAPGNSGNAPGHNKPDGKGKP
jgi:putative nucleotidyltransferase with HDIG domain